MADVEIYTIECCPYCFRAKTLLDNKGASYVEIDVEAAPERRQEMQKRAGGRHTVPQIFIDKEHVGGCDDLFELEYGGKLDAMLGTGG